MTDQHKQTVEAMARIIDPLCFELGQALDDAEGEPPELRRDATAMFEDRRALALSKADQIIAMQSQGREPVGFYCPTYLSRRKEYERNGMVMREVLDGLGVIDHQSKPGGQQ